MGRAERTAALTSATTAAQGATRALVAGESDGGGIAHAAGDLLTALGQVIPQRAATAGLAEHLQRVAEVYDRAARTPGVGHRWSGAPPPKRCEQWRGNSSRSGRSR